MYKKIFLNLITWLYDIIWEAQTITLCWGQELGSHLMTEEMIYN